jgi:5-methylcytosine-specific restriction endonuclease McrA
MNKINHRNIYRNKPEIYHNSDWEKLSLKVRRAFPYCYRCLLNNHINACQQVDHVIPHSLYNKVSIDVDVDDISNLRPICIGCHKYITAIEPGISEELYNRYARGDSLYDIAIHKYSYGQRPVIGLDGYPIVEHNDEEYNNYVNSLIESFKDDLINDLFTLNI